MGGFLKPGVGRGADRWERTPAAISSERLLRNWLSFPKLVKNISVREDYLIFTMIQSDLSSVIEMMTFTEKDLSLSNAE